MSAPSRVRNTPYGAIEVCASPTRCGGLPPSCCSSGVVIQSAMASNSETAEAAPSPVRPRAISASSTAS